MPGTGFGWVLLAAGLYGAVHSVLAAGWLKDRAAGWMGPAPYRRYYRLLYVLVAGVTLLPVLALAALLPDRLIYVIPTPWVYATVLGQALALAGIAVGVIQAGVGPFLGLRQLWDPIGAEQPGELVTSGLFRWVRHPLYACTFPLIWLAPVMSWNLLGLNLALSVYMLIGSIFEERKLAREFGPAYEQYRRQTPRIIPRFRRRTKAS